MEPGAIAICGVLFERREYEKQDKTKGYVTTFAWMGASWSSYDQRVYEATADVEMGEKLMVSGHCQVGEKGALKFQNGTIRISAAGDGAAPRRKAA